LEAAMAPASGEPEEAFGLVTRADLVGKIKEISDDCLAAGKFGWKNAIAQLKLLNSDIELKTEGMGMLKEVRDGKIVPFPGYQSDSESEEEGGSAHMDGVEHQGESAHEDDPSPPEDEQNQPEYRGANADASTLACPPPQLEPPIASWVLSPGTATMELVSRVILVGQ
ncbi:hypothetical protein A2U01_0018585, partial [Trifolium medium]|nr:hypothetical protein [Trifolium medium]